LQADALTLVARTVAADTRRFLQRPVIFDGTITVSPSWTDQFSSLPLPGGPDSGCLNTVFAQKGGDTRNNTAKAEISGSTRDIDFKSDETRDRKIKIQEVFQCLRRDL
jgi:hypothetical protein